MTRILPVHSLAAVALVAAAARTAFPGATPVARVAAADSCPWVRSRAPIAARVAQVVSAMSLDEKISLVHGVPASPYAGYVPAIPRLCVPALKLEDGPGGVADGMTGVTQLPAPVALAASWDTALARAYGVVVGAEEWGKGANVNLGPTVNIVRDPRWGRAFESYGEDPYLAGRIAVVEIQGVQSQGVLAQVKHWVAYNQETFRNTPADDVVVDRRTLQEIYMPAFEAAVREGGASSVMCAYSTVNGARACENGYTQDSVLKGRWRFDGFVTSDWGATHSTVPAATHGLDMQMPDTSRFAGKLRDSVRAGLVPVSRLDDMVRRILTQEFRFHLFDREQTGGPSSVVTDQEHGALARSVAEQGTVLLKNAGGLLPLNASAVRSIAVIGPGAGPDAMAAGGGSAAVVAPYVVTPFQGVTRRAGSGVAVRYAQGAFPPGGALPAVPPEYLAPSSGAGRGLTVRFYADTTLSGAPVLTRVDSVIGANWHGRPPAPGMSANRWSAKWTGTLNPPVTGEYTFSITSDDGGRLFVNGLKVIENWREQAPTTQTGKVNLTAGQPAEIEVDYYYEGGDSLSFGWRVPGEPSLLSKAVALAESSDVAVVVVGHFETEGRDLTDLDLSAEQNEMVGAVAAANPRTIVVLNTGSAVTMPWLDAVEAVLEAWYPGQEDGNALASVLFGDVNPSGKLPVTFPKSLADVPASSAAEWPGVGGVVRYSESLKVGYRWYDAGGVAALFPFGFGLSYTTFSFANLRVSQARGGSVSVRADVTNTGQRAGVDVVQVYVGAPPAAGEPPKWLVAFRKIPLAPGETRHLAFSLDARAFAHWDEAADGWVVSAGPYRIHVGDSSDNLPLSASVSLPRARLR